MPRQTDSRRPRLRIDRTAVKDQAVRGSSKGASHTLALPEGVPQWAPDKPGEYALRFLPYTITIPTHRDDRELNTLWYRFPYMVHFSVGGSDKATVCPRTFGKKCPICEEVHALYEDQGQTKKHTETIDSIGAKKYCLFAAIGVENAPGEIFIFSWNESKFAELLEKKLKKVRVEDAGFADTDDGRVVRFSTEMMPAWGPKGKPYLSTEAGSISFEDAGDLTNLSDEILDQVPDLGKIVHDRLLSYEQIDALFHGNAEPEENKGPAEALVHTAPTAAESTRSEPPPAPAPAPKQNPCKACNGTGKASSGRPCLPCKGTGDTAVRSSAMPPIAPPPSSAPAVKNTEKVPSASPAKTSPTAAPAAAAGSFTDEQW